MNFDLQMGSLYMIDGDKTTPLGVGIPFTEEIEMSANEQLTRLYHFNNTPSLNLEISGVDFEKLNDVYNTYYPNKKITIEADVNIMIQARWHKKPRINKKWLKRFGMKPDTVKMIANATVGEYHTDDGSFDFECDALEYLWRPDQLRKNLKIEM